MPWPAFAIAVPPGLLTSSHAEVFLLIVCQTPAYINYPEGIAKPPIMLCYQDTLSAGISHVDKLSNLGNPNGRLKNQDGTRTGEITSDLMELYDEDLENRLWEMLQRLAANTLIAINTARADKPEAFATKVPNVKPGKTKAAIHHLGKPMTIDVRQHITDFVSGLTRKSPSVTTLVRGHYRHQPYGPKMSLRRRQWIEPFLRGEGPMVQRLTRLKEPV